MKLLAITSALIFSSQVFAATPYTFNCKFVGDECKISKVTPMREVQAGIFGGAEGKFSLFYQPANAGMHAYLGEELKAIAMDASTLAVQDQAKTGLVGIVLGDDKEAVQSIKITKPTF